MAYTGIDFNNLTLPCDALTDLGQLVKMDVLSPERLGSLVSIYPNVVNGERIGFYGNFGLIAKAEEGCDPTYDQKTIDTAEKQWDLKWWQISLKLCWRDYEATLLKYKFHSKTRVDDLDFYRAWLANILLEDVQRNINAMAWFGDTSYSGEHTTLAVTDGFWKRLFAICADDEARHTTIASQEKSAMLESGVASGVLDNLIMDADPVLRGASNQVIYITLAMKDALDYDLKHNNIGSELQWKSLFDGITEGTYNGIKLMAIPEWDSTIKGYLSDQEAPVKNLYRAVYTSVDNLLLGISGDNTLALIDSWQERKDRANYLMVKDGLATMIAQDNLVQVAY